MDMILAIQAVLKPSRWLRVVTLNEVKGLMAGYGDVTQRPPAACPNQKMLYEFGQQPVLRQARSQSALPAGHPVGVGGEATTAIKTVPYFVTVWQVGQKYTFPPRYGCQITVCGWIARRKANLCEETLASTLTMVFPTIVRVNWPTITLASGSSSICRPRVNY